MIKLYRKTTVRYSQIKINYSSFKVSQADIVTQAELVYIEIVTLIYE